MRASSVPSGPQAEEYGRINSTKRRERKIGFRMRCGVPRSSAFALSDRSRHISEPFELLEVLRFFGGHFGVQGHFQIFGVDKSIFVCRRVEV